MGAQLLHVGHEMIGRVVLQVAQRHRAAAAALVEHDDAIELRIEEAAMHRRGTRARPAMQEDDRHALGIAALLPIDRVTPVDGQHSARVGRNLREEVGAKRGFRARHADNLGEDPVQSLPQRRLRGQPRQDCRCLAPTSKLRRPKPPRREEVCLFSVFWFLSRCSPPPPAARRRTIRRRPPSLAPPVQRSCARRRCRRKSKSRWAPLCSRRRCRVWSIGWVSGSCVGRRSRDISSSTSSTNRSPMPMRWAPTMSSSRAACWRCSTMRPSWRPPSDMKSDISPCATPPSARASVRPRSRRRPRPRPPAGRSMSAAWWRATAGWHCCAIHATRSSRPIAPASNTS